jgi:DNA-binding protein HU-beta
MNNKEFISELARRLGSSGKEAADLTESLSAEITRKLQEGNSISISGFGSFDIKKKMERISVNPSTKQRMLIPPKLALSFKPGGTLKDKFRDISL